jgi:hypothetical protein
MRISLFLIFLAASLIAAPVGNPAGPALTSGGFLPNPFFKLATGYLADYISDMRLSLSKGEADFDAENTLHRFGLHSQMATFSLSLLQRIEFYTLLGGSKEHVNLKEEPDTPLFSALFGFKTTYHFSWAAGARVVLLQWGQTYFSADGSYFTVPTSQQAFFSFLNRLNLPLDENEQHFFLREWQGGVALSSCFWFLTPYVGIKYLNTTLQIESGPENSSLTYRNEKRIGYYFGATLSFFNKFFLLFEQRLRDEFAYMGSAYIVF